MKRIQQFFAMLVCMCIILTVIPVTVQADEAKTYDAFTVTGGTEDVDYEYDSDTKVLKILTDTPLTIGCTDANNTMLIASDANITLSGYSVGGAKKTSITIEDGKTVNMTLSGGNSIGGHQDYYDDVNGKVSMISMGDTSQLHIKESTNKKGSLSISGTSNWGGGGNCIKGGKLYVESGTLTFSDGNDCVGNPGDGFIGDTLYISGGTISFNGSVRTIQSDVVYSGGTVTSDTLTVTDGNITKLNLKDNYNLTLDTGGQITLPQEYVVEDGSSIILGGSTSLNLDGDADAGEVHLYIHHNEVAATHQAAGKVEYYTCQNCGKIFDKDKQGVASEDALVIEQIPHAFSTNWSNNDNMHWYECSCGEKSNEAEHVLKWVIYIDATATREGWKYEECETCGYIIRGVTIEVYPAQPTSSVTAGTSITNDTSSNLTLTENGTLTLSTTTEDATIYYTLTTDESEPDIPDENSTKYENAIALTGTECETVIYKIKAIAVKDGRSLGVSDFTYTVQLPDTTAPTAKITIKTKTWDTFLNTVTFGHFFKDTKSVTITSEDTGSGVDATEYFVSETGYDSIEALSSDDVIWTPYIMAFLLPRNSRQIVYARVTDKAGNVTIVNSEGVVIYTDAAQVTSELTYIRNISSDLEAEVALNGNTISGITSENIDTLSTDTLNAGTDYVTDADGKITFKQSYLESLANGSYTLKVSSNPMGESYTDSDENDAPEIIAIALTVRQPKLTDITAPSDITGIANGTEKTAQALGLPATVTITAEDASVTEANVKWDLENPAEGSYDPSVLKEQTFKVNGTVSLPENIANTDKVSLNVQVSVTVSASENTVSDEESSPSDTADETAEPETTEPETAEPEKTETIPDAAEKTNPADATGEPVEPDTTEESPSITEQPQDAVIENENTDAVTFTVAVSGANLSYQWMVNKNDEDGWVNVEGANEASYTVSTADSTYNGYQYKCVITGGGVTIESNPVTLTISDTKENDTTDNSKSDEENNKENNNEASDESEDNEESETSEDAYAGNAVPDTGDKAPVGLLIFLMSLSAAVMAATTVSGGRRRKETIFTTDEQRQ